MHIRIKFLFILCLFSSLQAKTYYFFEPPKNWRCIDPKTLSPSVEVGFFGKGKSKYYPTINLASEEINISLSQYVKEVKKIHWADKHTSLRDLGTLKTRAGSVRLLELTIKTKFGIAKMLQSILVRNKKAIVLTAAMQKDEFIDMHKVFLKCFRSLTFTNHLMDPIQDPQKKQTLELAISDLEKLNDVKDAEKEFKKMQKMLQKNYQKLGSHWQLLILNEVQAKIANKFKVHNASSSPPKDL